MTSSVSPNEKAERSSAFSFLVQTVMNVFITAGMSGNRRLNVALVSMF